MTPDQKACQEAFEEWNKESDIGSALVKSETYPSETPYLSITTWRYYEVWKAAWRNRTEAFKPKPLAVGDFRLSPGLENENKIWIQRDGGEGGDFDIKEFEAAIEAFFVERM